MERGFGTEDLEDILGRRIDMDFLLNWRFWSFYLIATLPLWLCLIAGIVVMIEQKIEK